MSVLKYYISLQFSDIWQLLLTFGVTVRCQTCSQPSRYV